MSNAFKRYVNTLPDSLNPETAFVLGAFFRAIAAEDDNVEEQIQEGTDQLFIKRASGKPLDVLAAAVGVERPATLGLTDEEFRNLIPNLSLKPKNIRKAFYDTADVFWGPLFTRANIKSNNFAPFNLSVGDVLKIAIDGVTQSVKILTGDIATNGAATAEEVKAILSKFNKSTTEIITEASTGNQSLVIRTNTPGSTGSIEIFASSGIGASKLDFPIGNYDVLDLAQRVVVYNINSNELLIELPAIVPALRRTLRGSHHFHADSTIEPARGPTQTVWQGSFLFNPTGSVTNFTVTSQRTAINQVIEKGKVYTSMAVTDNSSFINPTGDIIFGFGTTKEEGPVKYRGLPNSSTILLDPSYKFKFDHVNPEMVNVISQRKPYVPVKNGKDLAVYLTSPSGAREVVQLILQSLAAAGIIVKFVVLAPKYKYVIDNPYISTDDAPGS